MELSSIDMTIENAGILSANLHDGVLKYASKFPNHNTELEFFNFRSSILNRKPRLQNSVWWGTLNASGRGDECQIAKSKGTLEHISNKHLGQDPRGIS